MSREPRWLNNEEAALEHCDDIEYVSQKLVLQLSKRIDGTVSDSMLEELDLMASKLRKIYGEYLKEVYPYEHKGEENAG
jgi:hypothetical protein